LRWHSITKILRNGPRAHFLFSSIAVEHVTAGVFVSIKKVAPPFYS
jgi:hypothetical protein